MEKQLKVKTIERIKAIYDSVKTLDGEIIELEKLGLLIADKKTEIKLNLSVNDLEAEKKEKSKAIFDEDGSLISGPRPDYGIHPLLGIPMPMMFRTDSFKNIAQASDAPSIYWQIPDKTAPMILGVLLSQKQEERNNLLESLKKYGFEG